MTIVAEAAEKAPASNVIPITEARKILQKDFLESSFAYTRFSVTMPVGWKIEDALKREFWTNVAHLLQRNKMTGDADRRGAIIELRSADHAFYAELYVRAVYEQGLDVALTRPPIIFSESVNETNALDYKMKWNPGHKGWDVVRILDNAVVGSAADLQTKEDAQELIEQLRG